MATNGKRITTEEATVKTVAIEIKALMVGRKQVTLAMFRQLIEEPIIDEETCDLRGVPWGTVNYHSGVDCDAFKYREHLHVTWQKGNELRRSCTRLLDYSELGYFEPRALKALESEVYRRANAWLTTAIAEGWRPDGWERLRFNDAFGVEIAPGGWQLNVGVTAHIARAFNVDYIPNVEDIHRLSDDEVRAQLRQQAGKLDGEYVSADRWRAAAEAAVQAVYAYRQKYTAAYIALDALDQIFIAL